ncbi:ABC-2 family transporter protein [Nocardioides dokdonensis FR1436]|uniref:ABC-2 family transporter protein n=1 Tax=Nocardioides dokdonensis FR1436 TaxID=1300347 RepID=A0A1A9GKP0_9ACTN|nr:ABC transporter permease subunit [Nocardioides dokdonensis]ANH38869.1 ABC-2 family transporter protein [Nocardioides dokdonensis FR1436]
MTTTALDPDGLATGAAPPAYAARPAPDPIPTSRLLGVELRKMFDTRSGAWLLTSIGLTALVATVAVVLVAPEESLTYDTFAAAIGLPMTVILPIVALLSVTSEWSQRTGLTTFTLAPRRGRVIAAKAVCALGIGVVSMLVAAAIGALGNLVGASLAGVDHVWDLGALQLAMITLATVLNMFIGFMLGLVLRSSAAALVAYFVYQFVLSGLTALLALLQPWFADLQPWVDFNYSQGQLFDVVPSAEQWAQLGVSGFFWLVLPLAVGLRLVLRSEVK